MKINLLNKIISWLKKILNKFLELTKRSDRFKELERKLLNIDKEIAIKKAQLEIREREIYSSENELKRKYKELKYQHKEIKKSASEIKIIQNNTLKLYKELKKIQDKLTIKVKEVEKKNKDLEKLKEELISKTKLLYSHYIELKDIKEKFSKFKERLEEFKKEDIKDSKKPYKRKHPTEVKRKKRKKILIDSDREIDGKLQIRKKIDLGKTKGKKRKEIKKHKEILIPSEENEAIKIEKSDTIIMPPFIEADLNIAKIYLVLPHQKFKSNGAVESIYKLELNGEKKEEIINIVLDNEGFGRVNEKRIELEKVLKNFKVNFPNELKSKTYSYKHHSETIYIFKEIGKNRCRMHYLYNKDGNINPIPKKRVWILLNENFEFEYEPNIIDERWVWENYQFLNINLKKLNELIIRNKQTGVVQKIPCETSFFIEGEQLDDDFKELSPLLIGGNLKIKASVENSIGWMVWIQNEIGDYTIINDNWTGKEPLDLKLPKELPCDFGNFQLDICKKDEGLPTETLFFRYINYLQLNYRKELVIMPDSHSGHKPKSIKVIFGNNLQDFELNTLNKMKVIENGYQINLPPEEDILRFSIYKNNKPKTKIIIQITIPRLKWKTSKQKNWNDKILEIKRNELISGEDLQFLLNTNDFNNEYNILAVLEEDEQELQEAKFIKKGIIYNLLLNQFYDTVKKNINASILRVEIRNVEEKELLHSLKVLCFTSATLHCKLCDFKSSNKQEIISHIEKFHISNFIEHLTLKELRKYNDSLPHAIYKCGYCNYYARGDDPDNPTSSIYYHIERDCFKVDRSKFSPRVLFKVIDNIDEIRKEVIPNLPHFYKCKICGTHFKRHDKRIYIEHLLKNHESKLFYY